MLLSRANRLAGAFLLGMAAILMLFVLGEGIAPSVAGVPSLQIAVFLLPQAAYFLLVAYLLSRNDPLGTGHDWAVLAALVAPLLLSTITAAVVESDKRAALEPAAVTVLAAIGAWMGSVVAGRAAKHRGPPGKSSSPLS